MPSKSMKRIEDKIREMPLIERLTIADDMICAMCKDGRSPKMSIPVQPTDEDVFISLALRDAKELIEVLRRP